MEVASGRGVELSLSVGKLARRVRRRLRGDSYEKVDFVIGRETADSSFAGLRLMALMGSRKVEQEARSYECSIELHAPPEHFLRSIEPFVDLADLRCERAPYYNAIGRPSVEATTPAADRGVVKSLVVRDFGPAGRQKI